MSFRQKLHTGCRDINARLLLQTKIPRLTLPRVVNLWHRSWRSVIDKGTGEEQEPRP
jgi:hypothetical protein